MTSVIPRPARRTLKTLAIRALRLTGADFYHDIKTRLPRHSLNVVFDVGANIGQTLTDLVEEFPDARCFAFEPMDQTFETLAASEIARRPNVSVHRLGFGSCPGAVGFDTSAGDSRRYRVDGSGRGVTVTLSTIDAFCAQEGIAAINLLKIDTEGHDLEVIKGSATMISKGQIDIVLLETSMHSDNTFHVPFCEIHQHMDRHGYKLFGLYEQFPETETLGPHLRRCNAAYISSGVIANNSAQ